MHRYLNIAVRPKPRLCMLCCTSSTCQGPLSLLSVYMEEGEQPRSLTLTVELVGTCHVVTSKSRVLFQLSFPPNRLYLLGSPLQILQVVTGDISCRICQAPTAVDGITRRRYREASNRRVTLSILRQIKSSIRGNRSKMDIRSRKYGREEQTKHTIQPSESIYVYFPANIVSHIKPSFFVLQNSQRTRFIHNITSILRSSYTS